MQLSAVIYYRNLLKEHTPGDMTSVVGNHTETVLRLVEDGNPQFPQLSRKLARDHEKIIESFVNFSNTANAVQQKLQDLVKQIEPKYLADSQNLYCNDFVNDSNEYILQRRLTLNEHALDYIYGRVRLYGNWRHAGLIIRPGLEPWINELVSCDPLYLVDHNKELLRPAVEQFNPQYQNRLRKYTVDELTQEELLAILPNNQFGFCLIFNYFNFKPIELVQKYLYEIYQKLKPGGTVAFTFNNCDYQAGVDLVERKFMCYTPESMIVPFCQDLGYSVLQTYQIDAACTWMELQKPGQLTTLRGGQSLARIVAKSK